MWERSLRQFGPGHAGPRDVEPLAHPHVAGVRVPDRCLRFEKRSFGALHHMLSRLTDDDREEAWAEITEALREFEGPDGFTGP